MMRIKKYVSIMVLIVMPFLSACNRYDPISTTLPIGRDTQLTINGEQHSYINYEIQKGDFFSLQLPQVKYTCGNLIQKTEHFSFYTAEGAINNEVVIRKDNEENLEELYRVCRFTDFGSVNDILRFFGITSENSITSVNIYTLQFNENEQISRYVLYENNKMLAKETYDLIATMDMDFASKPAGNIYGKVSQDFEGYESWANGVIKLDIVLSSGIILPVFFDETANYIGILDSVMSFSGHPNADAAKRLKDAIFVD